MKVIILLLASVLQDPGPLIRIGADVSFDNPNTTAITISRDGLVTVYLGAIVSQDPEIRVRKVKIVKEGRLK